MLKEGTRREDVRGSPWTRAFGLSSPDLEERYHEVLPSWLQLPPQTPLVTLRAITMEVKDREEGGGRWAQPLPRRLAKALFWDGADSEAAGPCLLWTHP